MSAPQIIRADHRAIASRIKPGARVLDVGCGEGMLLRLLRDEKGIDARGLELSPVRTAKCLAGGLSVIQGDADEDLSYFPDDGFHVAILSRTIQETRRPAHILTELARIAPEIIISFHNYGHWKRRWDLLLTGKMPAPRGSAWHDSAALHPSTATDMIALSRSLGMELVAAASVTKDHVGDFQNIGLGWLNWRAKDVILHLRRG